MIAKTVKSALISVYHKENLAPIVQMLHKHGVTIYSTGGTQTFVENLGIPVVAVEDLTGYPSIFGGRVKTLHPKVFGGILNRRSDESDQNEANSFEIPNIDLVIVDLYPFEATVASGASDEDIIEKIDIGGISLIRAAAKNFEDVLIVSSRDQYADLLEILDVGNGTTTLAQRKKYASVAFNISSHYDTSIFNYFNSSLPVEDKITAFKVSQIKSKSLRYGENPHQKGTFYGDMDALFTQHHGKELSYNNLVDIDAAIKLINEFKGEIAFGIIKHTNACGFAIATTVAEAYERALAGDPVSAFGGVLVTNTILTIDAAQLIDKLFFEVIICPEFEPAALELLKSKKNRVILSVNESDPAPYQYKNLLNGVIHQDADLNTDTAADLKTVTKKSITKDQIDTLVFASKLCKHTKSNAIILAKEGQMLASGVGQTSRVDALYQAIKKAKSFGFELEGSVMASDAFFPFPDCVEIAHKEGIHTIIQPGGSIKDQLSIDYCDENGLAMAFTGTRHFYH
jgi:phosphoribosylaminoimidazolecarboxamide formyltransferase/IMP cyclohydrolase